MQLPSAEQLQVSEHEFKAGRPRSEESRRAILDATRRLLTHMPVSKISIEAIAKKAGVGKTTIYRWWPNKQAVVMEAVFNQPGFQNFMPQSSVAFDGVKAQIDKMVRQLTGKNGRIVAEIIGECQGDVEILKSLVKNFFQDRYNVLAYYVQKGKHDGQFRESVDVEVAIDVVLGPIIFRLMSGQNLDDAFAKRLTDMVRGALAA
ncbi:MAG: TetR family transcriptional regulator [Micavibrio aeruginosavorus]|uniref:TetR family transcriptional regulator n=1 Tax=Micavibrio aeruginosavorus TaxID=349221 RepID=A0A2W5N5V9_9BACT|nr:MAG: TetR family transcriptional regulator [Micavibrio aeruginosavorus]